MFVSDVVSVSVRSRTLVGGLTALAGKCDEALRQLSTWSVPVLQPVVTVSELTQRQLTVEDSFTAIGGP